MRPPVLVSSGIAAQTGTGTVMLATWPMVFGALLAGLIVGVIVPDRPTRPDANSASKSANVAKSVDTPAPPAKVPAAENKENSSSVNSAAADAASAEQPCEQQTWPHLSPSCVTGAKQASQPVRVIPTRQADPAIALKTEDEPPGNVESAASASTPPEPKAASPAPTSSPAQPARAAVEAHQKSDQQKTENRSAPQPDAAQETKRPRRAAEQSPSPHRSARNRTYTTRAPDVAEEFADERPRVFIERDGTRIYVVPDRRYVRRLDDGPWRQW